MTTTLINLISEQTVPNLLPALALKDVDCVVNVVSSDAFKPHVRRLEEAIDVGWKTLHRNRALPRFESIFINSESPTVEQTRNRILKRILDLEGAYVVNYTGGTKNMSIGAYHAADITGSATIYCDTPRQFIDGGTGLMPDFLSMSELAIQLDVQLMLAAHGLFPKRDYFFTRERNAVSKFGEAAFLLYQGQPNLLRQFRAIWRKYCVAGKNRPNISDVARVEAETIPMGDEPLLADFLEQAVRCGLLKRSSNGLRIDFGHALVAFEKQKRLERVLADLEGGVFEAVVLHKLKASRRFTSFLHGVRPAGATQTADFGESDFIAYSPETLSLTLISCETSPPRLEHLESLLARKAKFGGRFATSLVCMEHEGAPHYATQETRDHQRSEKLQQLRLLGMQGAFGDQLDEILQVRQPSEPDVSAKRSSVISPASSTLTFPPVSDQKVPFRRQIAVLTGGPGIGKTTLLNMLAQGGMPVIREAALELINEMNEKLGVDGQREWRKSHFIEFQDMLIEKQLQLEAKAEEAGWIIADRGLLDIVGFCRFKGQTSPVKLTPRLLEKRYSMAFLLEPLPEFIDRGSTGRIFNREEAISISDCIGSAYLDAGVPVIRVPFMTVGERADFVRQHLNNAPQ